MPLDGDQALFTGPVTRELAYEATTVKRLTDATAAVHRL